MHLKYSQVKKILAVVEAAKTEIKIETTARSTIEFGKNVRSREMREEDQLNNEQI